MRRTDPTEPEYATFEDNDVRRDYGPRGCAEAIVIGLALSAVLWALIALALKLVL